MIVAFGGGGVVAKGKIGSDRRIDLLIEAILAIRNEFGDRQHLRNRLDALLAVLLPPEPAEDASE